MASSNKRERDVARARYEAQQRRREQESQGRRRQQQIIAAVVGAVIIVAGVGWFVWNGRSPDDAAAAPGPAPTAPSAGASLAGCSTAVTPTKKTTTWPALPSPALKAGATYTITLKTNCGDVVLTSTPAVIAKAPKTVNTMVFLAQQKFFDAADCFRLTTSGLFVLQCGSPSNDGAGGPGFTIPDENLPKDVPNNYPAGTVAMANEGPGTAGSQFFLVYKDTKLPPGFTIWGSITKGIDILTKIAAAGSTPTADGKPNQPLVIATATAASS